MTTKNIKVFSCNICISANGNSWLYIASKLFSVNCFRSPVSELCIIVHKVIGSSCNFGFWNEFCYILASYLVVVCYLEYFAKKSLETMVEYATAIPIKICLNYSLSLSEILGFGTLQFNTNGFAEDWTDSVQTISVPDILTWSSSFYRKNYIKLYVVLANIWTGT